MGINEEQNKKIAKLEDHADKINDKIYGNGQIGLIMQVDRLEQSQKTFSRLGWIIVTLVTTQIVVLLFKGQLG